MDFIKALSVWGPLAACPPVRRKHTGNTLPVAPENPDLGVFSLEMPEVVAESCIRKEGKGRKDWRKKTPLSCVFSVIIKHAAV